ncbi:hypothetical protein EXIGLDRAFT_40943 [Exidia glandulosa HHB12029]|uniref:SWIM-type domain-containing protein n=1 Tax=Exidia glandulosa HHB12029 TaxID=1314781 RepID=A0A165IMF0_EXIGL|nr:hypothetical protein EXIGLDRAFT_40943 [Exidia glandulosa HHB12029]
MLLFIVMGLDENRHGVPLAFLLFSAPTQNKKTSAGYDTDILTELLGAWRDSLGFNDAKEAFAPLIVITDTDARERAALLRVWPKVYLLLCKFHLRQCWRNHRNTSLKGKSPVLSRLKQRLARLEQSLVESVKHDAALALINTERTTLEAFRAESKSAVEKAIEHLDYLQGYWLTEDLWKSWSAYGRFYAANLLGRPVCTVLTTTNHLEAFNRVLKRTHLRRWQRNGRRLRIDVLVRILALKIAPSIFAKRRQEQYRRALADARLASLPGGAALLQRRRDAAQQQTVPVAFFEPDAQRDAAAAALLIHKQISTPELVSSADELTFRCYSELALSGEDDAREYTIRLQDAGVAHCTCPDFQHRGGACKHIRAALLKLSSLRLDPRFAGLPNVILPANEVDARRLHAAMLTAPMLDTTPSTPSQGPGELPEYVATAVDDILDGNDVLDDGVCDDLPDEADNFSDGESVATDLDDNDFDISIEHGSRAALDEQTLARVLFDFKRSVPKLGDLGEYLALVSKLPADFEGRADLQQARTSLLGLAHQLDRLLSGTTPNDAQTAPSRDPQVPIFGHVTLDAQDVALCVSSMPHAEQLPTVSPTAEQLVSLSHSTTYTYPALPTALDSNFLPSMSSPDPDATFSFVMYRPTSVPTIPHDSPAPISHSSASITPLRPLHELTNNPIPSQSSSRATKRKAAHAQLRPPSPEKFQKRKPSFNPM